MSEWLLSALGIILKLLPVGDILKSVIAVLRNMAKQTSNTIDDDVVNFIEAVFIDMGLISKNV